LHFSRPAITAVVFLALSATPAFAAGQAPAAARQSEHDRIVSYWTTARQAAAQPRDFVRTHSGFQPAAGKPGGGGSGSAVTGAAWTKGGRVAAAVGKVYFSMDGSNWQCSGSVATDDRSDYSLVLTAGHCAYDETAGGGLDGFATNWMFIPAWGSSPNRDCTKTTFGCWTADALVVHKGFATAGGFNTQATLHDFAFAVVGAGGKSGNAQLDSTAGSFGLVSPIDSVNVGSRIYAFGYPAAGKYKGNTLTYCAGNLIEDIYSSNATWGLGCDMTGGSSGGGWFAGFDESTGIGQLGSLNSYGYSGVRNMYGPKFNSDTQDVYNAAEAATDNVIVP
jgi:hypothetical protein